MTRPVVHIPGMGAGWGPPTDAELGVTDEDMAVCVCGCHLIDHAEAPAMPCLGCSTCETYREDDQ